MWVNTPDFDVYFGSLQVTLLRTHFQGNDGAPMFSKGMKALIYDSKFVGNGGAL